MSARNLEADVVVLGAGLAGHCAALAATEAGAEVVLLEKRSQYGGSTAWAVGTIAFAGTDMQERSGYSDSQERLESDLLKAGRNADSPNARELVSLYCNNQLETYNWLKEMGVTFERVQLSSGQSVPRAHAVDTQDMLQTLHERVIERSNATYMSDAAARRLTANRSSPFIADVEVEHGGEIGVVKARSGVILATGGFSRNPELLSRYAPELTNATPLGGEGNEGDGLVMALALGAATADMNYLKGTFGLPWGNFPQRPVEMVDGMHLLIAMYRGAIIVNDRGQRFVDESQSYKVIGTACLQQSNAVGFQIFDEQVMAQSVPIPMNNNFALALEQGILRRADTLTALAEMLGVAPDVLRQTVREYNEVVRNGHDDAYGRRNLGAGYGDLLCIDTPPFYACPTTVAVTGTYCGLQVDQRLRVLSVQGSFIPGLYAAGEVVGGFHGRSYMSGSSLGKSAVFGRLAGLSAANG